MIELYQTPYLYEGNPSLAHHPVDRVDGQVQVLADLFDAEEPRG
jgi:hypothetical protein